MTRKLLKLRSVVAIAICLAGFSVNNVLAQQMVSIDLQIVGNGETYLNGKSTVSISAVVGDSITLNAVPDNGWHFVKWQRDSLTVGTNADYTFLVTANSGGTITAQFEQDATPPDTIPDNDMEVEIFASAVALTCTEGEIKLTAASSWYEQDSTTYYSWNTGEKTETIVVTKAGNYSVTVSCAGKTGTASITITDERTDCGSDTTIVTPTQKEITLQITGNGSINLGGNPVKSVSGNIGDTFTLNAVADSGWSFTEWTRTISDSTGVYSFSAGTDENLTFILNEALVSYTAAFEQDQTLPVYGCMDSTSLSYNPLATVHVADSCVYSQPQYVSIDLQIIGNGETYLNGKSTVSISTVVGDSITLSAVPENGWHFVKWQRDSLTVSTNADYTFWVTANSGGTIIALFEQDQTLPVYGCTDPFSLTYNPNATVDDGTCTYKTIEEPITGCTDSLSLNYNPVATISDNSCVYPSPEPQVIYGCTDCKALNFNPFATDYEAGSCVYAKEENIFNTDIIETPIDTVGTQPIENCALQINAAITEVSIAQVDVLNPAEVRVHWAIKLEGGITILYEANYAVNQSGNTLFYLSIICKQAVQQQARSLALRTGSNETSVTGFTVSAIANIGSLTTIVQPKATDNFVVYPNPTTGTISIQSEFPVDTVMIYDNNGRIVGVEYFRPDNTIDISHLPNGIYFVQINGNRVKVVKQ
ncbi:MAG: T9SS type A sorting domain-containing protein [Bacteroidales bacterium]|jgi:hypothetical protein|nr:T9SS type A sorting domain-containing protein [Bacteroidales bacterium]